MARQVQERSAAQRPKEPARKTSRREGVKSRADLSPDRRTCEYPSRVAETALRIHAHTWLNPETQRLIEGWFELAHRGLYTSEAPFESFIYGWIAVNAWAAVITDEDTDYKYLGELKADPELRKQFRTLLDSDPEFREAATGFSAFWPIFQAKKIRRAELSAPRNCPRAELVSHYLDKGIHDFSPDCAVWHRSIGEEVPVDWPHTLDAVYRVRCNLFHGEKTAHSEMDQAIVRSALMVLVLFFERSGIIEARRQSRA